MVEAFAAAVKRKVVVKRIDLITEVVSAMRGLVAAPTLVETDEACDRFEKSGQVGVYRVNNGQNWEALYVKQDYYLETEAVSSNPDAAFTVFNCLTHKHHPNQQRFNPRGLLQGSEDQN